MKPLLLLLAFAFFLGLDFPINHEGTNNKQKNPVSNNSKSQIFFLNANDMSLPFNSPAIPIPKDSSYLRVVINFINTLIESGTDRYGTVHTPLFASIIMLDTHNHPGQKIPNPINGQRQIDRALFGGNLQHDIPLLTVMKHLSYLTGNSKYNTAAESYLNFFLHNCTNTSTGLWPWGEHTYWNFYTEQLDNKWHEYLGAVPLSFWEQAWKIKPKAIIDEANGCLNHVVDLKSFNYNRHANIQKPLSNPRPTNLEIADFPRAGGFYIQLWAFAYAKTGDTKYLNWIEQLMNQQQTRIHSPSGLMLLTSEFWNANKPALNSTHSCAISMLESIPLLGKTNTADRVKLLAMNYLEAVIQNTPKNGIPPSFTTRYGDIFLPDIAKMYAHTFRLSQDIRFLEIARIVAQMYAQIDKIPDLKNIPAQVFGSIINLLIDMNELENNAKWIEAAERFARQAIDLLYYNGLFRGATSLNYYESELGVSNLVYALLRLHCLTSYLDYDIAPITFQR